MADLIRARIDAPDLTEVVVNLDTVTHITDVRPYADGLVSAVFHFQNDCSLSGQPVIVAAYTVEGR